MPLTSPPLRIVLSAGLIVGGMAAIPLVRMAAACVTDVATFAEWGLDR